MLLSSTVHMQKSMQQLLLKMIRNEQNLERNTISEYPIVEMLRKMHGCGRKVLMSRL